MIGCSHEHLGIHVKGYDELAAEIKKMSEDAIDCISLVAKYDKGAAKTKA
jgi:hypothetical protein